MKLGHGSGERERTPIHFAFPLSPSLPRLAASSLDRFVTTTTGRIETPQAGAVKENVEKDETIEHRHLAAVGNRPEAATRPYHEVCHRHFATQPSHSYLKPLSRWTLTFYLGGGTGTLRSMT